MRRLVCVPIVHTAADMGSLGDMVAWAYRDRHGGEAWERHRRAVERMWAGVERRIAALELPPERLAIYQDGLPVCGREEGIVRELAGRGSLNHRLILRLVKEGATLLGTESPELLVSELQRARAALSRPEGGPPVSPQEAERAIRASLEERDRFIAARIAATLGHEWTGLIFIGALHDVERFLPPEIETRVLIHRLPFAWERAMAPSRLNGEAGSDSEEEA